MMMRTFPLCITLGAAAAAVARPSAQRQLVLPPDATAELLDNATEVLFISVLDVDHAMMEDEGENPCFEYVEVHAQVLEVNKSASGLLADSTIEFDSHQWPDDHDDEEHGMDEHMDEEHMDDMPTNATTTEAPPPMLEMPAPNATAEMRQADQDMMCDGWVGPSVPPALYPAWCGYVYLNEGSDGHMELAAYGDSFVPAEDMSACPEVHAIDDHEEEDDHGHAHGDDQEHGEEMKEDEDHHGDEEEHHHDDEEKEEGDHGDEEDEHAEHDHDHEHADGEGGEHSGSDSVACGEECTIQGSCSEGLINLCHAGETDECISPDEWNSHCADFGDTCGECGSAEATTTATTDAVSGATTMSPRKTTIITVGGVVMVMVLSLISL